MPVSHYNRIEYPYGLFIVVVISLDVGNTLLESSVDGMKCIRQWEAMVTILRYLKHGNAMPDLVSVTCKIDILPSCGRISFTMLYAVTVVLRCYW